MHIGKDKKKVDNIKEKEIELLSWEMIDDRYHLCYENIVGVMDANIRAIGKELKTEFGRDVIKGTSDRLKTPESICHKLKKKQLPVNFQNAKDTFCDLIGIRIVVMFMDDVYRVAELLKSLKGLTLVEEKDYIKEPKLSGYMSLHLIFDIETYHCMGMRTERFEIQIRTMAMDCWSALEHQMIYKKDPDSIDTRIQEELRRYSVEIAKMDKHMMAIRNQIDEGC